MGQNHPKKLVLSRETVRDLTKDVLMGIEGGKNKPYTAGEVCVAYTEQTTDPTNFFPCNICCL